MIKRSLYLRPYWFVGNYVPEGEKKSLYQNTQMWSDLQGVSYSGEITLFCFLESVGNCRVEIAKITITLCSLFFQTCPEKKKMKIRVPDDFGRVLFIAFLLVAHP